MLSTPMTSLNNRLQLALLNRERSKNALAKGFTLVELMIVIVIVGILSAVALPNFLSQTDKAKTTEAEALSKAFLTDYQIAKMESATAATAALADQPGGSCPLDTSNWAFACTANQIVASPIGFATGKTLTSQVTDTGQITIGNLE